MKRLLAVDYAIRMLQHLYIAQLSKNTKQQTAKAISQELGITYSYVVGLADLLKKGGLLDVSQGRNGGYMFRKPADEISIYDVHLALEGEMRLSVCPDRKELRRGQYSAPEMMQQSVIDEMKRKTIKQLVETQEGATGIKKRSCTTSLQDQVEATQTSEEHYHRMYTTELQEHDLLFDEILLFQTGDKPSTIEVHTEHGVLQVRGQISRISRIGAEFFSVHTSYVVNINHIRQIDVLNKEIELSDGRLVPATSAKIRALLQHVNA